MDVNKTVLFIQYEMVNYGANIDHYTLNVLNDFLVEKRLLFFMCSNITVCLDNVCILYYNGSCDQFKPHTVWVIRYDLDIENQEIQLWIKILDEKFGSYSPCYTSKNSNADLGPILSIHQACFLCDIHNVRFLDL